MEDQPCLTLPLRSRLMTCVCGSRSISTSSRSSSRPCRQTAVCRRCAGSRRPSGRSAGSSTGSAGLPVVCLLRGGPGGFALWPLLTGVGVACDVVTPSLIPVRSGDRVKTDRRDAKKPVSLYRAGLLRFVHPPTAELEGLRDLLRARDDLRCARMAARNRVLKQLLRQRADLPGRQDRVEEAAPRLARAPASRRTRSYGPARGDHIRAGASDAGGSARAASRSPSWSSRHARQQRKCATTPG